LAECLFLAQKVKGSVEGRCRWKSARRSLGVGHCRGDGVDEFHTKETNSVAQSLLNSVLNSMQGFRQDLKFG